MTTILRSPLVTNCPRTCAAIRDCSENISDIEDSVAERGGFEPSVPVGNGGRELSPNLGALFVPKLSSIAAEILFASDSAVLYASLVPTLVVV